MTETLHFNVGEKVNPPPRDRPGRWSEFVHRPKLTDNEAVAMVVIAGAPDWFCVEHSKLPADRTTALWVGLYRRGFDVTKRTDRGGGHYVFARWIHNIPTIPDYYEWDE